MPAAGWEVWLEKDTGHGYEVLPLVAWGLTTIGNIVPLICDDIGDVYEATEDTQFYKVAMASTF